MASKRRRGLQNEVRMSEPLEVAESFIGPLEEPPRIPSRAKREPIKPPTPVEPPSVTEVLPPPQARPVLEPSDMPPARGKRQDKISGLQLVRHDIKERGVPFPGEEIGFLMEPYTFMKMLLTLEPVAVVQVVHEVLGLTLGQYDGDSPTGRREWCKLSLRYLEESRSMGRAQVQRGIKGALEGGYIVRRPAHRGSYEYAIRWRERA